MPLGSLDAEDLVSGAGALDGERDAIDVHAVLGGADADVLFLQDGNDGILENTRIARHRRMLTVQQSMPGDQATALADMHRAQLKMQ